MKKIIWCIDDHTTFNNCEWYVRFDKTGDFEIITVNQSIDNSFKDDLKSWIDKGNDLLDFLKPDEIAIGFYDPKWESYTIFAVKRTLAMKYNLFSKEL